MSIARIRVADPSPPNCAACYQAVPEKRHVDFGASTDGPVLESLENVVGLVGHTVDEIVICETCIAEAAKLVDLEHVGTLRQELEAALAANDALHEQLRGTRENVTSALELVKRAAGEPPPPTSPNSLLPSPAPARKPRTKRKA